MFNKNNFFGIILAISHFFTDAIASFALVTISLGIFIEKSNFKIELIFYFMLYNFIAFGGQIFIGYFLDKLQDKQKSFKASKNLVIISFLFYLFGLIVLLFGKEIFNELNFIFSIFFISCGSVFFHIGGGNISLLSKEKKATILGIFASGGVIGLSFGYFLAVYYPNYYSIFFIILILFGFIIYFYNNFELEYNILNNNSLIKEKYGKFTFYLVLCLLAVLACRSAIWTNYQFLFYDEKMIIFYLAISAFFGKIFGGILEDDKNFKEKYFIFTGIISLIFIGIYSFLYQNIYFLLIGIFGLTFFISPITIILNKIFYRKKAIIISYTFGLSLILGYFIFLLN